MPVTKYDFRLLSPQDVVDLMMHAGLFSVQVDHRDQHTWYHQVISASQTCADKLEVQKEKSRSYLGLAQTAMSGANVSPIGRNKEAWFLSRTAIAVPPS